MSPEALRQDAGVDESETQESDHVRLKQRWRQIMSLWQRYKNVMEKTGFSSSSGMTETEKWIRETDEENIDAREEFFEGHGREIINWGIAVNDAFYNQLDAASPYISRQSKERWVARFKDPSSSVGFQKKKYWVLHQMPHYIDAWKKNAEKREELLKIEKFQELCNTNSRFGVIRNREGFLDLHFDKRTDLLAEANAAMLAAERMQGDLYRRAQSALKKAADEGILSSTKVGQWLERIFRSKADAQKVETFIDGNAANALPTLMRNWKSVKKKYDGVVRAFKSKGEDELPRGIRLVTEQQFLDMHYQSRLHYVEEMERRLMHGSDLSKEPSSFVSIRHAIDTKDWTEAAILIAKAKGEALSDDHRARLDSMSRSVRRFAGQKEEEPDSFEKAMKAKHRLDDLLHQVPSSMQTMITRLLRGPNANRSIHQFRWIVYNNKWCRAHGYLDFERAMKGASKDHEKETKFRKEHGMDTGLHDSIGHETADQAYFREKEFANHKATYLHINLGSGAPHTLAEWLEHERDPKVLYWTTFCGHENGIPMPDNWHNDLFHILTEMRSLTSTLKKTGYLYRSPNQRLMKI